MSALAEDRRSLLERIRSIRRSLRSATSLLPQETPIEEYERRRLERRFDAAEQIGGILLGWLGSHMLALVFLFAGLNSGEPLPAWERWRLLGPVFFGLVSVAFTFAAATVALRNAAVLRRRWLAAGLLPWAVLVAESTLVLLW